MIKEVTKNFSIITIIVLYLLSFILIISLFGFKNQILYYFASTLFSLMTLVIILNDLEKQSVPKFCPSDPTNQQCLIFSTILRVLYLNLLSVLIWDLKAMANYVDYTISFSRISFDPYEANSRLEYVSYPALFILLSIYRYHLGFL